MISFFVAFQAFGNPQLNERNAQRQCTFRSNNWKFSGYSKDGPQNNNKQREISVVYCLHGHSQTGRFTVWVNGKQNSGLVNFIPESCLLHKTVPFTKKTGAKARNWHQSWLWRNGTGISVCNIPSGETGLTFQMFCWLFPTYKKFPENPVRK